MPHVSAFVFPSSPPAATKRVPHRALCDGWDIRPYTSLLSRRPCPCLFICHSERSEEPPHFVFAFAVALAFAFLVVIRGGAIRNNEPRHPIDGHEKGYSNTSFRIETH